MGGEDGSNQHIDTGFSPFNLEEQWMAPSKEEYMKDVKVTKELQFNILSEEANRQELETLSNQVPQEHLPDNATIWRMHFLANGDELRGHFPADTPQQAQKNVGDFFRSLGELKAQYDNTNGFMGHAPDIIRGETNESFRDMLMKSGLGFKQVQQETEDDPIILYHPDFKSFIDNIRTNPFVKRYSR